MDPSPIDLVALERELCRISEITAARIVADSDGQIAEVHILSLPQKPAKQVVRDVQSLAQATFGLDLDRRIVSVVQLDEVATSSGSATEGETTGPEDNDPARINIEGVTADRSQLHCTARVTLSRGQDRAVGTAEGLVATRSVLRLVAQATLAALRYLEVAAARTDLESSTIIHLGDHSVAVSTVVVLVPPYEEVISGSAVVRPAGELEAVARSILDATNRRLVQLR